MSRDKHIEEMLEMAEILKQNDTSNNDTGHNTDYKQFNENAITQYGCGRLNGVSMLYAKGYRKAEDVADEIIDTIEENFEPGYGGVVEFKNLLKQLRTKYGGRAK